MHLWQRDMIVSLKYLYPHARSLSEDQILRCASKVFATPGEFNEFLRGQTDLQGYERLILAVWY